MPDRTRALAGVVAGILLFPAVALASSVSGATAGGDSSSVTVGSDSSGAGAVIINGRPCKVITEKGGGNGSQSGPVTVGGGAVGGSTTSPNGSSVTVEPGSSGSVTAGSGSSGNCVILRSPGAGK
jgi:hypothetical protein